MLKPKILAVETAQPEFTKTTDEILLDFEAHLADQPERFQKKIQRIFKYAEVDRRYFIMPGKQVLGILSFEKKNDY